MARAFRQLLDDRPAVAQVLVTRVPKSPQARRRAMEAVIDRLITSGVPGPRAAQCYGFVLIDLPAGSQFEFGLQYLCAQVESMLAR